MTVKMPHDAVDTEVYVKTMRGHSGIQMDPWIYSTWRKTWDDRHTSNMVTKDKLRRFSQERTHRVISLNKTAGRPKQHRTQYWSPRPDSRQQPKSHRWTTKQPSVKQHQLNQVRHQDTTPEAKTSRKRVREMSFTDSSIDTIPLYNQDEDTDTADEFQSFHGTPQSPPDYEKGLKPLDYVPKSPIYPPPDTDTSSVPDLIDDLEEQQSPAKDDPK